MLEWLSFKSLNLTPPSSASAPNLPLPPPHSQGNSTPATSTRSSPTPNVSGEYDLAVQANSYNEIRSMIQAPPQHQLHRFDANQNQDNDIVNVNGIDSLHHHRVLAQVLQPDRESIREVLLAKSHPHAPYSTLTRLVSTYFDHSENTCDLCLLLHHSVHRTRLIYAPLYDLIAVLPDDSGSLSKHLCDRAYDIFVEFDGHDNPFVFPHAHHDFASIRRSFSELKQQIESRRRKSHSRIRLIRRGTTGCAMCLIFTTVGAVVTTVLVTTHAVAGFAALAAVPFCNDNNHNNRCIPHPKKSERKERARLKQLDAAAKSTYVVNDLDTIDSLVDRLQTAVEGDKALVKFALERGRERHPIQEVLKQLRKNQQSFEHQLEDLEEHIFLFFNTVNKARSSLLQEICLHQTL